MPAYHHGNLRATLLAVAERSLRERGADQLSLRELAREAGVSHAAPRRHFADRQALLDALAEAGFARLDAELRAALEAAGAEFAPRLHAMAAAYLRFATEDAALLELMFTGKHREGADRLVAAAAAPFGLMDDLIAQGRAQGCWRPVTRGAWGSCCSRRSTASRRWSTATWWCRSCSTGSWRRRWISSYGVAAPLAGFCRCREEGCLRTPPAT
ncbi:TetR/AcrR family transcriptional regulator [Nonomuraea thailandensis]